MKLLELVLSLLNRLLGAIDKQNKRQEQQQHEKRVNDVQENPVNWFDGHFNGVRDNGVPENASEANEAYTRKHTTDERRRDDNQQG